MTLDTTTFDESPTDTPDPYASSSSNDIPDYLPSHIDISALPHGLPVLGPLTGYTQARLARIINLRFARLGDAVHRPLTHNEQQALADHTSKSVAVSSYGPAIGFGSGFYRAWTTRAEMRFPFYGKLSNEAVGEGVGKGLVWDGEKVRIGGREVMKFLGVRERARALHIIRGSAYVSLGMLIAPMIVSAYGATIGAVGELRDERLRDVTNALRQEVLDDRRKMAEKSGDVGSIGANAGGGQGRDPTGQGSKDVGELWRGHRQSIERRKEDDANDMSPTGGTGFAFAEDEESERRQLSGSDTGTLDDDSMQAREAKVQSKRGTQQGRSGTSRMAKTARKPPSAGEDYDDASPTGGSGATWADADSGSSKWDRIRQQASDGSTATSGRTRTKQQQQQQASDDSFSFSSKMEEKSYAKDEAQKAFDEQVEKERRGGDFGGGGWRS